MEPDPWEWQPHCYASVHITHKAVRQGRGADPAAHSLRLSPHIRQDQVHAAPWDLNSLSASIYKNTHMLCLCSCVCLSAGEIQMESLFRTS